jgi:hypothetical protein
MTFMGIDLMETTQGIVTEIRDYISRPLGKVTFLSEKRQTGGLRFPKDVHIAKHFIILFE